MSELQQPGGISMEQSTHSAMQCNAADPVNSVPPRNTALVKYQIFLAAIAQESGRRMSFSS